MPFKILLTVFLCVSFTNISLAQVGIGTENPDPSAMLQIESSDKGVLISKVSLSSTLDNSTISSPATGLLVYNTSTASFGNTAVSPGFYFYNGSTWVRLLNTGNVISNTASITANTNAIDNLTDNDTTYSAGTGLSLTGTEFSIDSSVVTSTFGGDLSLGGKFTAAGGIETAGTVTATAFVGDGSGLTGIFSGVNSSTFKDSFLNIEVGTQMKSLTSSKTYYTADDGTVYFGGYEGYANIAIGDSTLLSNTKGNYNIGLGLRALLSNQGGKFNIAIGRGALEYNTEGDNNIAIGEDALEDNTIGRGNIAIGEDALRSNNTGYNNIAIGENTLEYNDEGDNNIAIGEDALKENTSGISNIAIGNYVMEENTEGNNNIAIGDYALEDNLEGETNIAIGQYALGSNISGDNSIAIGDNVLQNTASGNRNTAIGDKALNRLESGNFNTALGFEAGADDNDLGYEMTAANRLTLLGALTNAAANDISNSTAIGYGAILTTSNTIQLGNSNVTQVVTSGTISASAFVGDGSGLTGLVISDNSIITSKIANDAVTTSKIQDNSITTNKISNGAVTQNKLFDASVSTSKVADNAITNAKLADASVNSLKIVDASITSAKLAAESVESSQIANGTITNEDIASTAAIDFSKLNITKADITGLGVPDTNTTYTPGTGLSLTGTELSIDSSVVTSSYGGALTLDGKLTTGGGIETSGTITATVFVGDGSRLTGISGGSSIFTGNASVTSNVYTSTQDFVFGSTQLNDITGTTKDNKRFFFDKSKGAFRAGYISDNKWDEENLGDYSMAMGYVTEASGFISTALGSNTKASGFISTALGSNTKASGLNSSAMGYYTEASESYSTSMGYKTKASGSSSTSMGGDTEASGRFSTAMGGNTEASGAFSLSIGYKSEASGEISTAMGGLTKASGEASIAMGYYSNASGSFSIAMGFSTTASETSSTAMGYATKASGSTSTAMGRDTEASGSNSTSMGEQTKASGNESTAMGRNTVASGLSSTAMGYATNASGNFSSSMGYFSEAIGESSLAMGLYTKANSYGHIVIGGANIVEDNVNARSWKSTDPIFTVGNGQNNNNRSNAFQILKNGNARFYDDLQIDGSATVNGNNVTSDQRLKTEIKDIQEASAQLVQLQPKKYKKKRRLESNEYTIEEMGFMAQDIQKLMPYLVKQGEDPDKILSLDYNSFIALLVKGFQEQQQLLDAMDSRLSKLEAAFKKADN